MKKILFTILIFIALVPFVFGQPDFNAMLKTIDAQSNFNNSDFSTLVTLITEDPEEGVEKKVARQFRRDRDDKFLILLMEPLVQKGQGYLRYEDNLWFYDPESRKFSHTSMKESFQDTDAKNSDFRMRTYSEDYKVTSYKEGKLGSYAVWIIDLEARHSEVTYPYKKIWVSKKNTLLLKTKDYSLTKRLMRTSLYPSYSRVGSSYTPNKLIFIDELVKGKKTQITLTNVSIAPIPDKVFTKAYVEQVNR